MTEVTRCIRSSHPDALESLKVLASINGVTSGITFSTDPIASEDGSLAIEMEIVSHNPIDNSKSTRVVKGLVACVEELSAISPAVAEVSEITSKAESLSVSDDSFNDNPAIAKLNSMSIPHYTYSHKLSMTAEELVENVPVPENEVHTKNLLFKDKKHGFFLVTCKTDAEINTKALGKDLKLEGKTNLRFADEKALWESLQVKPGCVGPMSIMNDTENKITLVLDENLISAAKIHSHPFQNDVSTALLPQDLLKFVEEGCGHTPVMLSFGTKSADGEPKAPPNNPPKEKKDQKAKNKQKVDKKGGKKGETLLAMKWKKEENFAMWYSDVITLSEMISYYDISGCYILRPWSYRMWELIQDWFNEKVG